MGPLPRRLRPRGISHPSPVEGPPLARRIETDKRMDGHVHSAGRSGATRGMVGGPRDFAVCLHRLDDAISGVRYLAQKALTQMTEARVEPTVLAWEEWRKAHPAWQITAEQAPAGVEAK